MICETISRFDRDFLRVVAVFATLGVLTFLALIAIIGSAFVGCVERVFDRGDQL